LLEDIDGSVGMGGSETLSIKQYVLQERVRLTTETVAAVAAQPVGGILTHGVTIRTNINIQLALGVMYEFEWTSMLEYPGEWQVEVGFNQAHGYTLANSNYRCEMKINDVKMDSATSAYPFNCLYN
jgi:hypothetical protein